MVSLTGLLLPILLSAVFVFIASSVIHMMLGYHANDYRSPPDDDAVRSALRGVQPGDYCTPHAGSMKAMGEPAFQQKMKDGPIVFITVAPPSAASMGPTLAWWFVYCLVVSVFAAYITGRALGPGTHYLDIFRFAGATAFIGYALANWQNVIWYKHSAKTMLKNTFDGLVYALLTAGTFGWLWPQ